MVPVRALVVAGTVVIAAACSPEATRQRDGGPGADPGNKILVLRPVSDPGPVDTTLWPGRAPAPVERLEKGDMPPPQGVVIPSQQRVQPIPGERRR